MVQSATRGKQSVCSRSQLLCYRFISWLCVYSHPWINKDCLQTRNLKGDVRVITFSLLCVKHFSGFIEALDSKWILCTLKKVLRQPHYVLTLQVSLFGYVEMISCLLCKFISPEVSVINLFANLRVFLVWLGNSSEFLSFFIEVSEQIWRKINYLLR